MEPEYIFEDEDPRAGASAFVEDEVLSLDELENRRNASGVSNYLVNSWKAGFGLAQRQLGPDNLQQVGYFLLLSVLGILFFPIILVLCTPFIAVKYALTKSSFLGDYLFVIQGMAYMFAEAYGSTCPKVAQRAKAVFLCGKRPRGIRESATRREQRAALARSPRPVSVERNVRKGRGQPRRLSPSPRRRRAAEPGRLSPRRRKAAQPA